MGLPTVIRTAYAAEMRLRMYGRELYIPPEHRAPAPPCPVCDKKHCIEHHFEGVHHPAIWLYYFCFGCRKTIESRKQPECCGKPMILETEKVKLNLDERKALVEEYKDD